MWKSQPGCILGFSMPASFLDSDWRLRPAPIDALRRRTGPTGGILVRDGQIGLDDERFEYRYPEKDPQAADNRAVRRAAQLGRPLVYFHGVGPGTDAR